MATKGRWSLLWRLSPLVIVLGMIALVYALGLDMYFTFETFKEHRQALVALVTDHYALSVLAFMGIYIVATALSIPGGALLSVAAGFLFAQPWSTLYVVIGATIGATLIFLVAKTALGTALQKRAAPFLRKMEEGFNQNAANYLLFLRFIPVFPFWLVNIAPAFFNVALLTYVWTTFVGIIPGSFVFTQAGAGLGAILDAGKDFSLDAIFNIQVRIALIALAIFAITPLIVKKIRKKRRKER